MSDTSTPPKRERAAVRQQRLEELHAKSQAAGTLAQDFPTTEPRYSLTVGTAMRDGALPEPSADDPVPEGTLAAQAHEINTRFTLAARNEAVATTHRLAAAILLAAAKVECERLHLNFKSWADGHVPQTWDTIARMAKIGAAPDPAVALEEFRADNARRNRALRAKKAAQLEGPFAPAASELFGPPTAEAEAEPATSEQGPPATGPLLHEAPPEDNRLVPEAPEAPALETTDVLAGVEPVTITESAPDKAIMDAIAVLNLADVDLRRKLADEAAARLPLRELRAHLQTTGESVGLEIARAKGKRFVPTIETMRADFDTLTYPDKAEFLRMARETIGADAEES